MRKFLSAAAEREAEGREAEQEAEGGEAEGEERYHNLFMNALNGIYQTTPEGRLVNANPEFARILGFDSTEDAMRHLTDVKHQLYVYPEIWEHIKEQVRQKGFLRGVETQLYRMDGSRIWVRFSISAVRGAPGGEYYEGTLEDNTSHKLAEKVLQKTMEKLRRTCPAPSGQSYPPGPLPICTAADGR